MDVQLKAAAHRPYLRRADFRLADGLTLLTGPDASARSQLVRLLALRWQPDDGEMLVGGEDVRSFTPERRSAYARRVGFAPGDGDLPNDLRVRQGLIYLAALWQVAGTARVDVEMERWGLGSVARRRLGSLSPGERRRFVLAASLLMEPELWLLEQPFDGLDVPGRTVLRDLLVSAGGGRSPTRVVLSQAADDEATARLPLRVRLHAEHGRVWEVAG